MSSAAPSDGNGVSYYNNSATFYPATAAIIVVLIVGCFLLAFLSVIVNRCLRGDTVVQSSGGGAQPGIYTANARGLQKEDIDALPLVHMADLSEKHDRECPVCLMEFEPEETLRLLPVCKHVFHQECIDMWFDSHSNCPLCRASLVGGDAEKTPAPGDAIEAVDTIAEVSENGDYSDSEVHGGVALTSLEADSLAAPQLGNMISREDERSSARGTLFRNSESFKRAARGVAAQENAAAAAAGDEKNPSFRKPAASGSMRRSSSLGTDLITLRNLLMRGDQNANANTNANPSDAPSRWFARAKSLELASRADRAAQNDNSREPSRDEWVTIDLETGKAAPGETARSSGESRLGELTLSKGPSAPDRTWSDRFSLTSLRGLKGIAILSRSTSDLSSRHATDLPI